MTATPPGTPTTPTTSASMSSESPEQPKQPASSASPQQSQSDGSLRTQLVRFIAVGVVCAVIDYGTTLLLDYVLGVPRGWAKAVG
ncbi:MAG: GtrA family protein, partial [Corynebacterium matruchotii]